MTHQPPNITSSIHPTTTTQTPSFQSSDAHHKESTPISNNSTFIDMKAFPKHKHRKTLKIKAYCGKCYQFFQNGPNSKICQEHLNKQCNLISCQKHHKNYTCIRKFPNTNSANRHTHCLKREDVVHWNDEYEIRNRLLGLKRNNADTLGNGGSGGSGVNNNNVHTCTTCNNMCSNGNVNVSMSIPQHNGMISPIIDANHNNNNINIKSSLHISSLTQSNNNINCNNCSNGNGIFNNATKSIQLFNSTNSLIKIDNNTNTNMNDTLILLPNNNNSDLNTTKYLTVANANACVHANSKDTSFNPPTLKNDEYNLKWETTTKLCDEMDRFDFYDDYFDTNYAFNNSKLCMERKNSKISQHFFNEQLSQHVHNDDDYFSRSSKVTDEFEVALHDTIDTFFNVVQKNTGVSNGIKKKLVKAFRKKGILNVRILALAFNKYNNWNFLIKKFKEVTSQIEGVTLCIEYLFKRNRLLEKL